MEALESVNIKHIANILDINNAVFQSEGELYASSDGKNKFVSEISCYSFEIEREINIPDKVKEFLDLIENRKVLFKKIFNEFNFNREIFIYTWREGEDSTCFSLDSNQIKLLSELGISLSITHYNYELYDF